MVIWIEQASFFQGFPAKKNRWLADNPETDQIKQLPVAKFQKIERSPIRIYGDRVAVDQPKLWLDRQDFNCLLDRSRQIDVIRIQPTNDIQEIFSEYR